MRKGGTGPVPHHVPLRLSAEWTEIAQFVPEDANAYFLVTTTLRLHALELHGSLIAEADSRRADTFAFFYDIHNDEIHLTRPLLPRDISLFNHAEQPIRERTAKMKEPADPAVLLSSRPRFTPVFIKSAYLYLFQSSPIGRSSFRPG
jgi:hypothetical protein